MNPRLTINIARTLLQTLSLLLLLAYAVNVGTCLVCDTGGCCKEESQVAEKSCDDSDCTEPDCPDAHACHCACALTGLSPVIVSLAPHFVSTGSLVVLASSSIPDELVSFLDRPPRQV